MQHIEESMSVRQVLQTYPFLMDLFKQHGLGKFEDPEVLEKLGPLVKLKTALSALAINRQLFLQLLEDRIEEQKHSQDFTLADHPERQGELTLLALLPCGMKMPFSRGFDAFVEEYQQRHSTPFSFLVEGNMNHELSYNAYIKSVTTIEELPDIIINADINSFYHPEFREAFLEKGYFTDILAGRMHPDLASIGYADPAGQFTMLSANLLVLVAINELAAPLPRPSSWKDILDEAFTNTVAMRGQKEFFCNGVLLPFYSLYGIDGIRSLARSVVTGCHPSEMVKMIDSGRKDVPAFYVMPYFFAKKIKRQESVSIIIPKEGAILSPVQMLVKKSSIDSLGEVIDFLCGKRLGQICADAHFPSTNPEVKNHLEGVSPLLWLGWDFLTSRDVGKLKTEIGEIFKDEFKRTGGIS